MLRRQNENQTRRHRLLGHDYSTPGFYFLTFNTKDGHHLPGEIDDDRMHLSPTGQQLYDLISGLPDEFPLLEIDCFAIMPNHVHLLVYLPIEGPGIAVPDIVRTIKGRSATVHRSLAAKGSGLWHKGFHDEVVRNDEHLHSVRRYIAENPLRWRKGD